MIAEGVRTLLQAIRHGVQALIPIFLLLLYTVLGAVIFYYVESPNERTELETLASERAELLESTAYRLNNIRGMKPINAYNHTVSTLEIFIEENSVFPISMRSNANGLCGVPYILCLNRIHNNRLR
uniref:TWiK family of potassium channels protein 18 n=1 Tax=Ascaris suum TaxID=6253 RepID=F1LFD9_ASCSU